MSKNAYGVAIAPLSPTYAYLYRKHSFAVPNPQHFRGM